jgi:hypothetical protein
MVVAWRRAMSIDKRFWYCLMLLASPLTHGAVLNGDFSNGLTAWSHEGLDPSLNITTGDVSVNGSNEAEIGDDNHIYSALYQGIDTGTGSFELGFDFRNDLSNDVPTGTFPDTLNANVYLTSDRGGFDLADPATYDHVFPVFSADYNGLFDINIDAIVGPSTDKGPDWLHISFVFDSAQQFLVPAFELDDFNFIDNDSVALIDNVTLSPAAIPAPNSLCLMFIGAAAFFPGYKRSTSTTGPS